MGILLYGTRNGLNFCLMTFFENIIEWSVKNENTLFISLHDMSYRGICDGKYQKKKLPCDVASLTHARCEM